MYHQGTLKERLVAKISIEELSEITGCWNCVGCRDENGYVYIKHKGKVRRAHQLAYEAWKGEVPERLEVTHTCNNPACINPNHLIAKTHGENIEDSHMAGNRKGIGNYKLTVEDVLIIRASNESNVDLAKRYGVTCTAIYDIRVGKNWRSV